MGEMKHKLGGGICWKTELGRQRTKYDVW